jgi:hypothetical protein
MCSEQKTEELDFPEKSKPNIAFQLSDDTTSSNSPFASEREHLGQLLSKHPPKNFCLQFFLENK